MKGGGKSRGLTPAWQWKLWEWSRGEGGEMGGVAVKCYEIAQNTGCEVSLPARV